MRRAGTGTTRLDTGDHAGRARLDQYGERVNPLAERIRGTNDVGAIIDMLTQALTETRRLQAPKAELQAARRKVAEAERNIESMKSELEQVKAMLQQDPLTGTLNRRGLDVAFRQEASRCDRHGSRLRVALIDLDNFKALNDTHGHPAGDRALVHVSRLVRGLLRPTDRVGRIGGEEFLLLLPDTRPNEAAAVMARIRGELTASPLDDAQGSIVITFSCGIAGRLAHEPLDALVARADAALYAAKRGGKNRCMQRPKVSAALSVTAGLRPWRLSPCPRSTSLKFSRTPAVIGSRQRSRALDRWATVSTARRRLSNQTLGRSA